VAVEILKAAAVEQADLELQLHFLLVLEAQLL
jgi:hypothetical protein